ncbi:ATP-binding protein [Streptomyces sp. UNOC14_S4]|uniref:ATP-binding protein n=1 Tax=Streptomyces sp. UNOC14_S4 TaxID=2872340 RepID=UPI001E5C395A|nr:ATP-binding protein [Streptomyces sp. UNOC14_S4]MCC3766642.1 ATP-binding protein [Streptomyces sp. UNOC14_S4]
MSTIGPCFADSPELPTSSVPIPGNLSYSFGMPGGAYCLSTARTTVHRLLHSHGLADMAELGVLAASELLGNACLFTPDRQVSLSIRWRFGVLRLTVFDEHPRHSKEGRDSCRAQRRAALGTLDSVLEACGGLGCGLDEVAGPLAGNKMWAAFSRDTARNYTRL